MSYINGYIERKSSGRYEGDLSIEGISLSPIVGVMFQKGEKNYLWLKRKDMLEYDANIQKYVQRKREPRWEAYLEKQMNKGIVAYKGTFAFMRFRFSITGLWDKVDGLEKSRINFFISRLPMEQQDIVKRKNI